MLPLHRRKEKRRQTHSLPQGAKGKHKLPDMKNTLTTILPTLNTHYY